MDPKLPGLSGPRVADITELRRFSRPHAKLDAAHLTPALWDCWEIRGSWCQPSTPLACVGRSLVDFSTGVLSRLQAIIRAALRWCELARFFSAECNTGGHAGMRHDDRSFCTQPSDRCPSPNRHSCFSRACDDAPPVSSSWTGCSRSLVRGSSRQDTDGLQWRFQTPTPAQEGNGLPIQHDRLSGCGSISPWAAFPSRWADPVRVTMQAGPNR
jgi:hypothetical protein